MITNLKDFPTVYSPTLNNKERVDFMTKQAKKYKINLSLFPVKDYYYNRNDFNVFGELISPDNFENSAKMKGNWSYATFISYLRCMEEWYSSTNDEFIIVCDDDTDFSTCEHWNFTWGEFVNMLPSDWECTQLIRIRKDLINFHKFSYEKVVETQKSHIQNPESLNKNFFESNYTLIDKDIFTKNSGGGVFLLKRHYVKKLLDYFVKENGYFLEINFFDKSTQTKVKIFPFPETCMVSQGKCYNFPLFIENAEFKSNYWNNVHIFYKNCFKFNSRNFYNIFWKEVSKYTTINKLMRFSSAF